MSEPQYPAAKKVIALVDGFNLYHSIDDFVGLDCLKWLNIRSLVSAFVQKAEVLHAIYFFTAMPPWSAEKRVRQQTLLDAYHDLGVLIVPGHFKQTRATCLASCRESFAIYEEKQTDINIALQLTSIAREHKADVIMLVTGDSDQVPSIRHAKEVNGDIVIRVLLPPFRKAKELMEIADDHAKISQDHFARHRLPELYRAKSGAEIRCPGKWLTTSSTSSRFTSLE